MAYESYVLVCGGTACCSSGGNAVVEAFKKELEAAGLKEKVQVVVTGCLGFCEQGPIVKILPQGTFYVQVQEKDVKEIVAEHLVKGRVVQRLCYDPEQAKKLAKVLNAGLRSRTETMPIHVNLIPVNEVKETGFRQTDRAAVKKFAAILEENGIRATLRRTLGADINASCGQLRRANSGKPGQDET